MANTYSHKCYELAVIFLSSEPKINTEAAKDTLASIIQQAIEDELEFMRAQIEKAS